MNRYIYSYQGYKDEDKFVAVSRNSGSASQNFGRLFLAVENGAPSRIRFQK